MVTIALGLAPSLTHAALYRSLDVGMRGTDVTELQTYLSNRIDLYPERLVTGYYGSLTAAAIQKFQCAQSIVCEGTAASTGYGRVGPLTLAKLTEAMGTGGGSDVYAPSMSSVGVSVGSTVATISWTTNESARGKVYYATSPLTSFETSAPFQEPVVNGTLAQNTSLQTSQSIQISNLTPNTTYYYLVSAIDARGNVTLGNLTSTFKTTQ